MDRQSRIEGESNRDLGRLPKMLTLDTTDGLTYQMKPSDNVLFVDTTNAGGDAVAIVTLPSLVESVGQLYFIQAPVGATGGDLSVYEKETGAELTTYGDMDADNDHAIFYSTGQVWLTLFDGVA